jgi:DNA-binding GntR family transcriptional regulator
MSQPVPMSAPPSPEPRPLYDVIYDVLREHLVDRSFSPGLVFRETVVARAFGSSRIPAAAALQRLKAEGLLRSFDGRGLLAAGGETGELVRKELVQAGLRLPASVVGDLEIRNHHERIYPQIEHTIAAALAHGRFLVNETALAEHYGVSRTVAHEVLTRLERSGLIAQEGNQRWYAGPLTVDKLHDHFEMRWLLEPVALGQSMDALDPAVIVERRANVEKAMGKKYTALRLEKLETELHVQTVLTRANAQMVESIRRSQLPLIPTHSTFAADPHVEELRRMLEDHHAIYELILAGNRKAAMRSLEAHVKRALEPNIERLRHIGTLPESQRPPFLLPVDSQSLSGNQRRKRP